MYKAGYEVGCYISLEAIVEEHKDGYYDALYRSSQGWHDGSHSLTSWWEYLLGVALLGAYQEFERRVGTQTTRRGAKRQLILDAIDRLPKQFRYADLRLPGGEPPDNQPGADRAAPETPDCVHEGGRDATWEKRDRKR